MALGFMAASTLRMIPKFNQRGGVERMG